MKIFLYNPFLSYSLTFIVSMEFFLHPGNLNSRSIIDIIQLQELRKINY